MRKDIELCISDLLIPNAFSMGERTIVVTKGRMESMTEEQSKGILVHECGHIIHGDTKTVVYTFIGNGILNITMVICPVGDAGCCKGYGFFLYRHDRNRVF